MSTTTFGALVDAGVLEIGDGYRAKLSELGGDGPLLLRSAEVGDGSIAFVGDRFRAELVGRLHAKLGRPSDTVVTTKGASTGRTAFVPPDAPEFVYSPHLSYWRSLDESAMHPQFLRYWARAREFREQLAGLAGSTDMSLYLSLTDQRRLKITLPSPRAEEAIGETLASLDNKIELNRRLAATANDLAYSIFRSRYRTDDPNLPHEPLGEHVEVVRGLSYTSAGLADEGVPLHNLNSVSSTRGYERSGIKHYTGDYDERHLAAPGEVVVASVDLTWNFEVIASPARIPRRFGTGLFSQDLFLVRPRRGSPLSSAFLYLMLRPGRLRTEIAGYGNGTTVNRIPVEALQKPRFAVPPRELVEEIDALVTPLFDRAEAAEDESETLAQLRDTLLPKLVSGEVRLRDAGEANVA